MQLQGKLRILLITGIFPPDIGGPATYVPQVARALAERGHKIIVVTLSDRTGVDDSEYPFRVVRLPRGLFKPWRWFLAVWTILKLGRDMDVLFINGLAFEAVLANFLLRKPMVQKVVGDLAWERAVARAWVCDNFEEFQVKHYGLRVELLKALRSWWTRRADKVIVPSCYLAHWVSKWGVPENKLVVIHNALKPINDIQPAKLPLKTPVNAVTVGRLISWKRVDTIIKAVAHIENMGLVIIGDGPERDRLERIAQDLHVANRVYFAGQRDNAETLALMAACDIFILNSTYEGLPHVVLEAMSLGLPVVATAVGGTPEVVVDGANGVLLDPTKDMLAHKMQDLAMDPAKRERLAKQGQQTVSEKFNIQSMLERTEQLLVEVAGVHL